MKIQSFSKLVMGMLAGLLTLGTVVQAATVAASSVKLTEVEWHGTGCYRIEMPMGTVYFEKDKGVSGFKSFIDPEGNDWVASYLKPGPNGNFRGFPNSIGNFGHAGRNSGSTTIIVDGKTEGDHVILESSNDKFTFQYWFFPDHIAIKVLKSEGDYHFLLEGVAGGTADAEDFFVTADGKKHIPTEEGEFDDFTPEWIYLGDPKSKHLLFFAKSPEDNAPNENHRQIRKGNRHNMDLYSFGRTGIDNDPKYHTYGMSGNEHVCIIGFASAERTHQEMSSLIEGFLTSPFSEKTVKTDGRPRVIVTSDGEIDDQCSMIRFLLYTNECDVEAIVLSSSQYHSESHGHWAGNHWVDPDLDAYEKIYPNLLKHDPRYPTPDYLRARTAVGNVKVEGDMAEPTAGSNLIVKVLLDKSDDRPIWMQAWGGMNTIARALKTIEEDHPERMAEVAAKCRFFFIWEQDSTYQDYIRPVWGKYEIPTIVSDQFEAIAYRWKQIQPEEMQVYFNAAWMKENILENHGPLCSIYAAHKKTRERNNHQYYAGDFQSEGDSPAFLHTIVTGLRNMESPDWGGWGGRYVRVRENTWLDPVPVEGYTYPDGRWYTRNAWGRQGTRQGKTSSTHPEYRKYFKPMWRWSPALQNDFAARADWCVKPYDQANHPPIVKLAHTLDLTVRPGQKLSLSAKESSDPDGDALTYRWWQYQEADSYKGGIEIVNAGKQEASFTVPEDAGEGITIHIICEVTDSGTPPLTRYQRVVVKIE